MRRLLAVFALALAGCTSAGGTLVPIRATGKASGDAEGPQVFVGGVPMNALVRVHGNVTYTIQAAPPYVTLDGDYTIVVEPMPGKELEAQEAIERGDLLIRREGQPGNLNAPGSVRAMKLRSEARRVYVPANRAVPPPPPPPAPAPEAPKPVGAADGAFCDPNDPACQLARHP